MIRGSVTSIPLLIIVTKTAHPGKGRLWFAKNEAPGSGFQGWAPARVGEAGPGFVSKPFEKTSRHAAGILSTPGCPNVRNRTRGGDPPVFTLTPTFPGFERLATSKLTTEVGELMSPQSAIDENRRADLGHLGLRRSVDVLGRVIRDLLAVGAESLF